MSPVRRHFWQVVARVNSSFTLPRKWSLNWFMPAGVNSTEGSQRGTSTSLGRRTYALRLEEGQILFAKFVGFHRSIARRLGPMRPNRITFFQEVAYESSRHDNRLPAGGLGKLAASRPQAAVPI